MKLGFAVILVSLMLLLMPITASPTPTPMAPAVTFVVDKNVYVQGEPVILTITNTGVGNVTLPNTAPWWVEMKTDGEWAGVYGPMALQVICDLPPGSRSWTWNQTIEYDGHTYVKSEKALPGTYRIGIYYWIDGYWIDRVGTTSYTQEFEILPTPPTPGFEAIFATVGLLAIAYLIGKRREY